MTADGSGVMAQSVNHTLSVFCFNSLSFLFFFFLNEKEAGGLSWHFQAESRRLMGRVLTALSGTGGSRARAVSIQAQIKTIDIFVSGGRRRYLPFRGAEGHSLLSFPCQGALAKS